jgi:hypothetical protein
VWSSQLAANDFPPICVMTGAPAETWRKFRFSRGATGHLPLTRASSRKVAVARWIPVALVIGSVVVLFVALVLGGPSFRSSSHATRELVYTNWVKDPNSAGGPHPGYKPAFVGLSNSDIQSASAATDLNDSWVINVTFTVRGAETFDRLTRSNVTACQLDSATGSACAERFLTMWLDLTQLDLSRWDDPAYQAQLLVPFDSGCRPSTTVPCGKLVVDAVTLDEIKGGAVEISGNFSRQSATDLAAAIHPATTGANATDTAIALGLAALGFLLLLAGIIGAVVIKPLTGPRAKVTGPPPGYHDNLVELRNVHPAFVAAVLQRQHSRAETHPPQSPPLEPGSN